MEMLKNLDEVLGNYIEKLQPVFEDYTLPYAEHNMQSCLESSMFLAESYGLINELGLVKYIAKQSLYPSWLDNILNILASLDPKLNLDLYSVYMNIYTELNYTAQEEHNIISNQDLCRFPRHSSLLEDAYQDGFIKCKLWPMLNPNQQPSSAYQQQDNFKPTEGLSYIRDILNTDTTLATSYHQTYAQAIPETININAGIINGLCYTTTTSIPLGAFSPINAQQGVMIPCKDIIVTLLSDYLQVDSRFKCDFNSIPQGLGMLNILERSDQDNTLHDAYAKLLAGVRLKDMDIEDIVPLGRSHQYIKDVTQDSPYYEFLAILGDGDKLNYILQRGTDTNSGICIHLTGDFNKQTSSKLFENLTTKESFNNFLSVLPTGPIGTAEPVLKVIHIGTYKSRFDTEKYYDLSSYYLWDYVRDCAFSLPTPLIKKQLYTQVKTLLPPITNYIISCLQAGFNNFEHFESLQDFYAHVDDNMYDSDIKMLQEHQANTIDLLNQYIDNHPTEPIRLSVSTPCANTESFTFSNISLKKYHASRSNKTLNLFTLREEL